MAEMGLGGSMKIRQCVLSSVPRLLKRRGPPSIHMDAWEDAGCTLRDKVLCP